MNAKTIMHQLMPAALLLCAAQLAYGQAYAPLCGDVQYRICALGNGKAKIGNGCYVQFHLVATTTQNRAVFNEVCWCAIGQEPVKNALECSLKSFSCGDSIEMLVSAKALRASLISHRRMQKLGDKEVLKVRLRIMRVVEADIVLDDEYKKFCSEYLDYERGLTMRYLQQHKGYKINGEIWKKEERKGNGKKAQTNGDVLRIVYEGRFLNSEKFDESGPNRKTFEYVLGQKWQVVDGLEKALKTMSEGERAMFIIPSNLAFGVKGLADIVPPFTPVIYDVEVEKVMRY